MSVSLCQHQFSDHTTCKAVALRNHAYCTWHRTESDRRRRFQRIQRQPRVRPVHVTISRHPNVIQHSIQQIIDALATNRLSNKRAGLLLYAITNTMHR